MKTAVKEPGKTVKTLGIVGLSLCALCCALPIIGIVGGAGILSVVSLYAEKIAMVLLILSAAAFAVWFFRRRQAPACSVDCSCKEHQSEAKIESQSVK